MSNSVPDPIHPAALPPDTLLEDCDIRRTKAAGPGGQHRNKVETAVEITHRPTGIQAMAVERRSQEANRRVATTRLRLNLAVNWRNVSTDFVEPSALWASRCRNNRIICSEQHVDFPSMLAEAMDAVDAKSYDVKRAAAALGCSTSQLIRFIARSQSGFEKLNAERESRGMKRLKP